MAMMLMGMKEKNKTIITITIIITILIIIIIIIIIVIFYIPDCYPPKGRKLTQGTHAHIHVKSSHLAPRHPDENMYSHPAQTMRVRSVMQMGDKGWGSTHNSLIVGKKQCREGAPKPPWHAGKTVAVFHKVGPMAYIAPWKPGGLQGWFQDIKGGWRDQASEVSFYSWRSGKFFENQVF